MSNSRLDNFSDQEFKEIVASSFSITEVTKRCGFKAFRNGGGRESVAKRIRSLKCDTSHFKTTGRQYEKPPTNKITDYRDVLKKDSTSNRITVRDVVLREGLLEYKCNVCGNRGIWCGKLLALQLHHEDGDATNNEVSNLSFLCPNCHSQTDTYGGKKNAKDGRRTRYYCTVCGKEITRDSRTGKCRECSAKATVIPTPSKAELIDVIKEIKFKKYICYHYGVCDHTLAKWLNAYQLPTHISELHKHLQNEDL